MGYKYSVKKICAAKVGGYYEFLLTYVCAQRIKILVSPQILVHI